MFQYHGLLKKKKSFEIVVELEKPNFTTIIWWSQNFNLWQNFTIKIYVVKLLMSIIVYK